MHGYPPLTTQTFDISIPPGDNFNTAESRLRHPEGVDTLRGILALVPGSNGDGRSSVEDPAWRELAERQDLGLLGVHMTDRRHGQMFIEYYVEVSEGSGDALLEAVDMLADISGQPRTEPSAFPALGHVHRRAIQS